MGDDTRELLNAHHAAVLRELDTFQRSVASGLSDLKHDMGGVRSKMDTHAADDNTRFGAIDNSLSVLKWAYGVGLVVLAAIFAALKLAG